MPGQAASPRQAMEQLLGAIANSDPDAMADCHAARVTFEAPFEVDQDSARTETTREELRSHYKTRDMIRTYKGVSDVTIHETGDPEVVISEFRINGEVADTGEMFSVPYIMVTRVRDGEIIYSRDYEGPHPS